MFKTLGLMCLLAIASSPAWAITHFVQGTFSEDDDNVLIPFTIIGQDVVTIESFGYAGGLAPNETTVPRGGFPTTVAVYDAQGLEIGGDNGSNCPAGHTDAVTGNCGDAFFQQLLNAGTYTVALLETDNAAAGNLSDGFTKTGQPGFTCAEFGSDGNFCDTTTATGTPVRNGNYALAISATDLVTTTPEPSSLLLISAAGAFAAMLRLRKNR